MREQKNSSTAIWVAFIGLIGTVLVAVIANIDKINKVINPETEETATTPYDKKTPPEGEKIASSKPLVLKPTTVPLPEKKEITATDKTVFKEVVTGTVKDVNGNFVEKATIKCSNCLEDIEVYSKSDGTFRLPFSVYKHDDMNQEISILVSGESFHVRILDPKGRTFIIQR